MSTTTMPMTRELALHTIIDAYKKGCDFTTLEIIAGGVLDKFAEYQWSLPSQGGSDTEDSSSIKADNSKNTAKKAKKPKAPTTPLDCKAFRAKFNENPTSIKKSDLVKAIGKNGFNIGHLCPEVEPDADGKKKGNKMVCMTTDALRAVLTQHFEAEALADSDDSEDEDEPKVEEQPITTGTHTKFTDDN